MTSVAFTSGDACHFAARKLRIGRGELLENAKLVFERRRSLDLTSFQTKSYAISQITA